MQIRYHFIGDLDTIVVDKTLGAPNLPLSALYGRFVLCNLADISVLVSSQCRQIGCHLGQSL